MPGLIQRLLGIQEADVLVWHCDPLVVVHAEDGIVFARRSTVEYKPEDPSGRTGRLRVLDQNEDGWAPQLQYSQRIENPYVLDPRVRKRPGYILIGEDETGEPFTWYVNGEADRYLTMPPPQVHDSTSIAERAEDVLAAPVERSKYEMRDVRHLHIVRADGFCPLSGPTQIKISRSERPPVLEHWTSLTRTDDGSWPELYVLGKRTVSDGLVVRGLDAKGAPATWYLDSAAEDYISAVS